MRWFLLICAAINVLVAIFGKHDWISDLNWFFAGANLSAATREMIDHHFKKKRDRFLETMNHIQSREKFYEWMNRLQFKANEILEREREREWKN